MGYRATNGEVRALGGVRYQVDVDRDGNRHTCFAIRSPFTEGEQATAWAPVIDNEAVLHHYILWGSDVGPPDGARVFECEPLPNASSSFITGWAPGGPNNVLPDDVGLVLDQEWLYLQIHYYNPGGPVVEDRSGVALCTTTTPRPNPAGVLAVGTVEINIPPRSRDVDVSYVCPQLVFDRLGEFTILGSSPHMHELGRRFLTEVLGPEGRQIVSQVDPWDFDTQLTYLHDPPIHISTRDRVRITGTYDNPTDSTVRFGENTQDEMCFGFMLVYPITNWPAGVPRFCADVERCIF